MNDVQEEYTKEDHIEQMKNWKNKCTKYEQKIQELEISIGQKCQLVMELAKAERRGVEISMIDLSQHIGRLKKSVSSYKRCLEECRKVVENIEKEIVNWDQPERLYSSIWEMKVIK